MTQNIKIGGCEFQSWTQNLHRARNIMIDQERPRHRNACTGDKVASIDENNGH